MATGEGNYRIDTCVECCVRDRDFSKKRVYQCELCGRWFCEKHIEPRLAFVSQRVIDSSPEIAALYREEMQHQNGHPDFEYSRRKFAELEVEEKVRLAFIEKALDSTKKHNKGQAKHFFRKNHQPTKQALQTYGKPKATSFPIKKVISLILVAMIIGALILYAPFIISYISSRLASPPSSGQTNWETETFQLVQGSLLAPVAISRHFELKRGERLVGNFQFTNLPSYGYEIGVTILDPLQGVLQVFINKTSGSFDIKASISGAYEMMFIFVCTRQVSPPSVILKTRIVS